MKHHNATYSSNQGTRIEYAAYIGMDEHKDTIAVAVALPGRTTVLHRDVIRNTTKSVNRLLQGVTCGRGPKNTLRKIIQRFQYFELPMRLD